MLTREQACPDGFHFKKDAMGESAYYLLMSFATKTMGAFATTANSYKSWLFLQCFAFRLININLSQTCNLLKLTS